MGQVFGAVCVKPFLNELRDTLTPSACQHVRDFPQCNSATGSVQPCPLRWFKVRLCWLIQSFPLHCSRHFVVLTLSGIAQSERKMKLCNNMQSETCFPQELTHFMSFPIFVPKKHDEKCLTAWASSATLFEISKWVDYFNYSRLLLCGNGRFSVSGRTRGYTQGEGKETLWNVRLTDSEHTQVQQWPELRPRTDSERTNFYYCAEAEAEAEASGHFYSKEWKRGLVNVLSCLLRQSPQATAGTGGSTFLGL